MTSEFDTIKAVAGWNGHIDPTGRYWVEWAGKRWRLYYKPGELGGDEWVEIYSGLSLPMVVKFYEVHSVVEG